MIVTLDNLQQARERVAELNELIFDPDGRLGFEIVAMDDLKEQDLNANVMPPEMFNQLVQNIKKNGAMESIPLTAVRENGDQFEIVSGHHRIRAAREAGEKFLVVLCYRGLTESEIRAKQLAHNSIQGKSDPEIVTQIFNKIEGLDLKMEAYIDTDGLMDIPSPVSFKPADIDLLAESKTVTIVFMSTQARDFKDAIALLTQNPDEVYLAHREAFEGFKDAVTRTRKDLDIRSIPAAITEMSNIVIEKMNAIRDERTNEAGD